MRGFALCGIAFVNVPALWRLPFEAGRDKSVQEFFNLFGQQRFFPFFSLLFAIGFGLMWTAARTRAVAGATLAVTYMAMSAAAFRWPTPTNSTTPRSPPRRDRRSGRR